MNEPVVKSKKEIQEPLSTDVATSQAIDNIASKVIATLENKNYAQKFDRPDGWGGVFLKYGVASLACWGVSKTMDTAYNKLKKS